ncbi:hypothetical protein ZHAS_00002391 [Anopheles sinensis]|uniref:Uncharacterized protein n=1 Tax=Anopheles sinensis TaxID=74873 RepID=A0A084VC59_ANOSI|nr:hypothetical protein ZHAS_00002391 [Anopheles sinensis]
MGRLAKVRRNRFGDYEIAKNPTAILPMDSRRSALVSYRLKLGNAGRKGAMPTGRPASATLESAISTRRSSS